MRNSKSYLALLATGLAACSPSTGGTPLDGAGVTSGTGASNGAAAAGSGASGGGGAGAGSSSENGGTGIIGVTMNSAGGGLGFGKDGGCPELPFSAEQVITEVPVTETVTQPIDLYIMFDQSASMTCPIPNGGNRWDAVKKALAGFVQAPASTGISVGIQYFGDNGLASSCNPANYEKPDVEIAPLPPNAQPMIGSLNGHTPTSNTPTPAALSGAINHALAWKGSHPNDITAVVLVTDGQPNACGAVQDVAAVATAGWGNGAGVRTFVVGITAQGANCFLDPAPPNVPDLDKVALGGGTQAALIVDTTADPVQQFTDRLNQIRQTITVTKTFTQVKRTAIACQYAIPALATGVKFVPTEVNVNYTGTTGAKETIFHVDTVAACGTTNSKAWYYDDAANPTKILLCPTTCTAIQGPVGDGGILTAAQAGAAPKINVLIGCATKQAVPS